MVQRESTNQTLIAIFELLIAGATLGKMRAEDQSVSVPKRDQLMRDSDPMIGLFHATKEGKNLAVNRWHRVLTVIVGRCHGIVLDQSHSAKRAAALPRQQVCF